MRLINKKRRCVVVSFLLSLNNIFTSTCCYFICFCFVKSMWLHLLQSNTGIYLLLLLYFQLIGHLTVRVFIFFTSRTCSKLCITIIEAIISPLRLFYLLSILFPCSLPINAISHLVDIQKHSHSNFIEKRKFCPL